VYDFINCILDTLFTRDIGSDGDDPSGIASFSGLKVFSSLADVKRINFRRAIAETTVCNPKANAFYQLVKRY